MATRPSEGERVEHAWFATTLGACAIAWGERGVVGVWLPDGEGEAREAGRRAPADGSVEVPADAIPEEIARAIAAIAGLLRGEPRDLAFVTLDESGVPELDRKVYAVARGIAPGHTLTYGEVARRIGSPGAARAVGAALGRNPFPLVVPCHRVLAAGGKDGGFSAPGGVATKRRLLEIEGAPPRALQLELVPRR